MNASADQREVQSDALLLPLTYNRKWFLWTRPFTWRLWGHSCRCWLQIDSFKQCQVRDTGNKTCGSCSVHPLLVVIRCCRHGRLLPAEGARHLVSLPQLDSRPLYTALPKNNDDEVIMLPQSTCCCSRCLTLKWKRGSPFTAIDKAFSVFCIEFLLILSPIRHITCHFVVFVKRCHYLLFLRFKRDKLTIKGPSGPFFRQAVFVFNFSFIKALFFFSSS